MTKIASFLLKPFWNINKYSVWKEKCHLLFSNISFHSRDIQVFKICKLAKWWRHILNQILIRFDEKRYLSQFVTEMFDFLQEGSTKGAAQYAFKSFVTMATYWVPDLLNIKSISGHLQRSIFIFADCASREWSSRYINMLAPVLWPCLGFFELKITNILK